MPLRRCAPLVLMASVVFAIADPPCTAAPIDPRELNARKEFAAGRYDQSVEIFAGLFAETGDPVFLRNIARCYQKLKRPDEAIANFQEYLTKGNLSSGERAEIESYVEEMPEV
jgi:tetratricopeptide (TPR) repeat protein